MTMAAVRRSTRLSSINKTTPTRPTSNTTTRSATTSLRHSEIWRQRHIKNVNSDDDENENEENNENLNDMNKMVKSKSKSKSNKQQEDEIFTTPRSKKRVNRPMPSSKKRELLKRFSFGNDDDDDDDEESEDEQIQKVSPPKQARHQQEKATVNVAKKHLISPTRLMDRLSIEEIPETILISDDDDDADGDHDHNHDDDDDNDAESDESEAPLPELKFEEEQPVTESFSKYQNARRVLNSAETENLPGREEQMQELRNFFTEHLDEQRSGSLYVSGQPGTGKTACLSLLLHAPEYAKRLQRIYINCTSIASVGAVYKKICVELNLQAKGRTEREYIAAIIHHLRTAKRMLLIVLDEIDQLCSSRQSVLYTIFEWPAIPKAKILLVGIANSLDLTDRALIRLNARCELKPRLMHFPPYTKQQIIEIFKSRLEQAGVLDVFPSVSLQLLAAKVSAVSGDVRRALDIGRRVIEIAEQQRNAGAKEINLNELELEKNKAAEEGQTKDMEKVAFQPVHISQVASVLNKVYGASQNLQDDIEDSFPLQQKIMLCTLMLMLKNERNKDITIGRLHEVYRRVCNKRNIQSLDQSEFSSLVNLVETRGIFRVIRHKEPRLRRVQLQWDEDEVYSALKDKQLIASILNDVACLNKMQ